MMSKYAFKSLEDKWQKFWDENKTFSLSSTAQKPYYVLEMFPYPSGALHVGHVRNYVLGDVMARFKAAQGFRVLHPIGWDAFGLPAENAALIKKAHPKDWTYNNIASMRQQIKSLGLSYDWQREFATCDASYFAHEQEMFIKFWQEGLIVRKDGVVNWDPVDQTILANEQVEDGRGWRSGALIEKRKMRQWFVKQSDFAQELLDGIDELEGWPESVRCMQRNWIGRSEGALITFIVEGEDPLSVFSTRPETLYGATFCAVSVEHVLAQKTAQNDTTTADFIESVRKNPFDEKKGLNQQKGVLLPYKAQSPVGGEDLPIYAVNYVLADYGTGAIFGCPAHDERDFAFAQSQGILCKKVIQPKDHIPLPITGACADEGSVMVNSDVLDGQTPKQAFQTIIELLEKRGTGSREVRWRLRDWCVSRQRYWGTPVPMILCDACGVVPVPFKDLPVTLPEDVTFDKPGNPLERHPTWKHVLCPVCGEKAQRDTDTLDTFFESCWYFLRFISQPQDKAFDAKDVAEFLPVDWYIGGVEHAVMHLLYARLFTIMLARCGYLKPVLPFKRLLTQGMICYRTFRAEDGAWINPADVIQNKDGTYVTQDGRKCEAGHVEKMSKSKNNTVNPDEVLKAYGADALRLFVVSDAPPERHFEWNDAGLHGAWRFAKKIYTHLEEQAALLTGKEPEQAMTEAFQRALHNAIFRVTEDINAMRLHLGVAHIRTLYNVWAEQSTKHPGNAWHGWRVLVALLEPFMPHLCAEIRERCGFAFSWPQYDERFLVQEEVTVAVQINGKLRGTVVVPQGAAEEDVLKAAQVIRERCNALEARKIIFVPDRVVNVIV